MLQSHRSKKIFWSVLTAVGIIALVFYKRHIIFDLSRLSPTIVSSIVEPKSIDELQTIVKQSKRPISIAGGRFSQGGQIAYPDGLMVDMLHLNKIISCDPKEKTITVQPGIRWSEIQSYIDQYDLSVKIMQSYNDFTVGGALSVNAHGRDPLGSLIKTVKSMKIMLADGSIQEVTPHHNSDLFNAVIGGYGLLGPIIEATLQLTDNEKIERFVQKMSLEEYPDYFAQHILHNKKVVFHSANIYPNEFTEILSITWLKTNQPLTVANRMQTHGFYLQEKIEEQLLRRIAPLKKLRQELEPQRLQKPAVVWRNYEMSYSVTSLEPIWRFPTTSILQEYFVPTGELIPFIHKLKKIILKYDVNVLNIAIRYVPADNKSILTYAPHDSFAFVCYINVFRTITQTTERAWTQELIDAARSVHGTFYLPYHLYATQEEFRLAYPNYQQFLNIKKKWDPTNKFKNSLYNAYLS